MGCHQAVIFGFLGGQTFHRKQSKFSFQNASATKGALQAACPWIPRLPLASSGILLVGWVEVVL